MMTQLSRLIRRGLALGAGLSIVTAVPVTPLEAQQPAARPAGGLSAGQLRVGDRIVLSVEDEPTLTDTFTVRTGPAIDLPRIGEVPLAGVSRGGVQAHLETAIGKYIKNPVVLARTLVRVAVLGEVTRAGFFALPADAPISDAINEAGGLTTEGDMRKVQLSRRGKVVQKGGKLRNAIAAGSTLDDLGMEAGDEIMIPRKPDTERMVRILSLVVAIPLTVLALGRM